MSLFEYLGITMRGNLWNYYLQGVLHAHTGCTIPQMYSHIIAWKFIHGTPGAGKAMIAATLGYKDYEYWQNKIHGKQGK